MGASFLGHVVHQLKAEHPAWEDLCFVLPNRRARLFLQKELATQLKGSLILPEMLSIDDFVGQISSLLPAPELMQQQLMYQSYCAACTATEPDSFELFLGWSSTLLKDLSTMDQYLLDRKAFFSYLGSLHDMRAWGQAKDELVVKYTAFWQLLPQMFQDFSERLADQGYATAGICYRLATESLENYLQHKSATRFIFCGFNALSPSESTIIQELLAQGKARVFWDIDKKMLQNKMHQAGNFIREYIGWKNQERTAEAQAHDLFHGEKKVQVIEVQQQLGQAKQLGALLASMSAESDWSKTAVVLADEALLLPLLYALPENINKLNITMGFPLAQHPLANFVAAFLNLSLKQSQRGFYFSDVESLLTLPETKALLATHEPTYITTVLQRAKKQKRSYLSVDFLIEAAPESLAPLLTQLFTPQQSPLSWIEVVRDLLPLFYAEQQIAPLSMVYRVAVEKFLDIFQQIYDVMGALKKDISFSLLRSLYLQLVQGEKVNFVGAPLEGLQILGVLETRTIDFDRVLIAGVNEGILPSQGQQNSWIPFDVKKEFMLPTQEDQDAIFTYHFYRLMYRTKEVYLLYNGTTDGIQVGERSRFIRQWAFEKPDAHQWEEQVQEARFIAPEDVSKVVPKTQAVLDKLKERATKGFSPSALNVFIKDPYTFYTKYLLGIEEEMELEDSFSHRTFGTLVHYSLEALYTPYIGKILSANDCDAMIQQIEPVVASAIAAEYPQKVSGKNMLALAAIKRYIQNLISYDKQAVLKGEEIELLALEQKLNMTRFIAALGIEINFRGTVDRVDRHNGFIRVIDYKTGQVASSKLGIYDWSLVVTDPDYGQARQLLLYALMWNENNPENQAHKAGIIALKQYDKGVLYVGEKETPNAKKRETELTKEVLAKATATFDQLCMQLFDSNSPFQSAEL